MYKNNLKEILKKRGISIIWLSKEIGVTRQGLTSIIEDPFKNTTVNVLTKLLEVLDISFYELGKVYSFKEYLDEQLIQKCFDVENLRLFSNLIMENTGFRFLFSPYQNGQSLNFSIDRRSKINFSGNIRINVTLNGLTFEVLDFDFYKINLSTNFETFLVNFSALISSFEQFAIKVGFNSIIFHVDPNFKNICRTKFPFFEVNNLGLEKFINLATYSNSENELIKLYFLIRKGYIAEKNYDSHHTLFFSKQINNSVLSPKKIELSFKEV